MSPDDLARRVPVRDRAGAELPVEVWGAVVDASSAADAAALAGVLDAQETARVRGFRHRADADAYLVAHVLLRSVLARATGVPAGELALGRAPCPRCAGPHGRPVLAGGGTELSLSHSRGHVLVAVADEPVGVDVEPLPREVALPVLLDALTAGESRALAALPARDRPEALCRAWVRKEAYLKGLGTGLGTDPALVEAGVGPHPDQPPGWHVADVEVPPGHRAAVALRSA